MSEASFASLGPTLLARKGGAKPAMRPQLAPLPDVVAAEQLEDLGWNDMGSEDAASEAETPADTADIVSIKPAAKHQAANEDTPENALIGESPVVQRKPRKKPAIVKTTTKTKAKSAKAGSAKGRRAAFTLRLDRDRHLKLRLAATMQGVSAQALVTRALDTMLSDIEDLDTLAAALDGRIEHK